MKGIAGVLLAATPLAILVLYFALTGQKQIQIDQKQHEIKVDIDNAKFDLEFEALTGSIQGKPLTEKYIVDKKSKIAELEKKKDEWNNAFDAEFKKSSEELNELKDAINDKY